MPPTVPEILKPSATVRSAAAVATVVIIDGAVMAVKMTICARGCEVGVSRSLVECSADFG